jgi:hypothetical protein
VRAEKNETDESGVQNSVHGKQQHLGQSHKSNHNSVLVQTNSNEVNNNNGNNSNIYYNCTQKAIEKNSSSLDQYHYSCSKGNFNPTSLRKNLPSTNTKPSKSQKRLLNSANRSQLRSCLYSSNNGPIISEFDNRQKDMTPNKKDLASQAMVNKPENLDSGRNYVANSACFYTSPGKPKSLLLSNNHNNLGSNNKAGSANTKQPAGILQ